MEINYYEAFGLEEAQDENAATETAGEAQEAAQEQPEEQAGTEAREAETPADAGQEAEKKPAQTPEERARQAEGRRRREWEERGAKAERERNSAVIARLSIKNPTTDDAFANMDELEAYDKGLRETRLKEGRANDADIRAVVQEEIARAREPEQSAETQPSPDPRIDAELRQIQALDPDLAKLGNSGEVLTAILQSEYGQKFRAYVDRKMTFMEAYKLAAGDKLDKQRAAQAAEAARVQAASKDHLSATGTRGQGALSVPADIMAQYRVFMPDASAEEIQKHYNADRKRYGPK